MAGMLPGVEAARRRRFHPTAANIECTRRSSSACLYVASNRSNHFHEKTQESKNPIMQEAVDDKKLEATAREAKKRLDQRLQNHRKSEVKRDTRAPKIILGRGEAKGPIHVLGDANTTAKSA